MEWSREWELFVVAVIYTFAVLHGFIRVWLMSAGIYMNFRSLANIFWKQMFSFAQRSHSKRRRWKKCLCDVYVHRAPMAQPHSHFNSLRCTYYYYYDCILVSGSQTLRLMWKCDRIATSMCVSLCNVLWPMHACDNVNAGTTPIFYLCLFRQTQKSNDRL